MCREAVLLVDELLGLVDVEAANARLGYGVLFVVGVGQLVDAPAYHPYVTLDGASFLLVLVPARGERRQGGLGLGVVVELLGPVATEGRLLLHLLRCVFQASEIVSVITFLELFVGTEIVGVVCS